MRKFQQILLATLLFFACSTHSNAQWNLTGNSNVTNSNFLGTTNSVPLQLATKSVTRLTIDSNGKVGIATAPALSLLTYERRRLYTCRSMD